MDPVEILQNCPYTSRSNSSPSLWCLDACIVFPLSTLPTTWRAGGEFRRDSVSYRNGRGTRGDKSAVDSASASRRTSTNGTLWSIVESTTLILPPFVDSMIAVPPSSSATCGTPG